MVSPEGIGHSPRARERVLVPPIRSFATYNRTLQRSSSIAHWQLRDVLSCCVGRELASADASSCESSPSSSLHLYVARHTSVMRHSLCTGKSSVAQALPFSPTSMTAAHGYVAAGGQHGQLDVRRHDGTVAIRGVAGGSVNNALSLCPTSPSGASDAGVTLFVCNNDCTIKAFALPPPTSASREEQQQENVAPAPSSRGRRARGVRGSAGASGRRGGDPFAFDDDGGETEAMSVDGEENDCDEDEGRERGNDGGRDSVAAAFEDHHRDSLEQRGQQEQREQRRRRPPSDGGRRRESLMASLEARVAAAVAAAVGAAEAAASGGNGNGGRAALRPSSANDENVPRRRRASAAAPPPPPPRPPSSSARAARLAASRPAAVVRCLDPVNYCAPSPPTARGVPSSSSGVGGGESDGSESTLVSSATLAAVGDCPTLSLHAPTPTGYRPLASWDVFDDAGMACAWSESSGSFVAAVAQCGTVVVVDPRAGGGAVMRRGGSGATARAPSSSVVARWRASGGGAARAVKVSPADSGPVDLMLVTEHDTYAHLVDVRRFDSSQLLEVGGDVGGGGGESGNSSSGSFDPRGLFLSSDGAQSTTSSGPTANGGHHLSGAAFSPEGDLAFVSAEDRGIAVFDVRTAERCCVGDFGFR